MTLTIGALARRFRVSPRALRHYESLGLLRPSHVDRRTGYRYYGDAELARGLKIEQLKAAGLPLSAIGRILDTDVSMADALEAHRSHLLGAIAEHRNQLAVLEAMLEANGQALTPELVDVEPVHALVADAECAPDDLTGTVRRLVQRLRRDAMRLFDVRPSTYSAHVPTRPGTRGGDPRRRSPRRPVLRIGRVPRLSPQSPSTSSAPTHCYRSPRTRRSPRPGRAGSGRADGSGSSTSTSAGCHAQVAGPRRNMMWIGDVDQASQATLIRAASRFRRATGAARRRRRSPARASWRAVRAGAAWRRRGRPDRPHQPAQ